MPERIKEVIKMTRRIWRRRDDDDRDPFDDWFDRWGPIDREFPSFGSDIFEEFDEQFRRTEEYMNRIFREAYRNAMKGEGPAQEGGGPYVYGWSFRVGPDGVPHFEEFGNVPRMGAGGVTPTQLESREPLVDVIEAKDSISVTAEVPGVDKEDIEVEVTEDSLTIRVDKEDRKYYKHIELPAPVDSNSATATYRNGILDIEIKKAVPEQKKGRKINIG